MPVTTDVVLDLFDHMEWADAQMWDAALKSDAARTDDKLRWLMLHLHGVQRAFLDAWMSQPFAFRNDYSDTTIEKELPSVRAYYPTGRTYLAGLTPGQLSSSVALPWSKWAERAIGRPLGPTTLGETILQAISHSAHHRAQANIRLREVGVDRPPVIDYIAWLWLERPKPAWPAVIGA
jgi:uncharacterized damage-inducible protein DinB